MAATKMRRSLVYDVLLLGILCRCFDFHDGVEPLRFIDDDDLLYGIEEGMYPLMVLDVERLRELSCQVVPNGRVTFAAFDLLPLGFPVGVGFLIFVEVICLVEFACFGERHVDAVLSCAPIGCWRLDIGCCRLDADVGTWNDEAVTGDRDGFGGVLFVSGTIPCVIAFPMSDRVKHGGVWYGEIDVESTQVLVVEDHDGFIHPRREEVSMQAEMQVLATLEIEGNSHVLFNLREVQRVVGDVAKEGIEDNRIDNDLELAVVL